MFGEPAWQWGWHFFAEKFGEALRYRSLRFFARSLPKKGAGNRTILFGP
jgi:hypothetical protein